MLTNIHLSESNTTYEILTDSSTKIKQSLIDALCDLSITHQESNKEKRFELLSQEVIEHGKFLSSLEQIALHPSYQEIIGMGKSALPLIFQEIPYSPTFWFWALEAITGKNPVRIEHKGIIKEMVNDWIRWAKDNNIA